jgi:glycosyltransferase involved in cell wall biosynthesis
MRNNSNQKKIKILFISNNYRPYSGGVVSALTILIDELIKRGHEVKLLTLDFGVPCKDESYVIRIPSAITFLHKGNHMAIPWRIKAFIKKLVSEFCPDIIHTHHPFLLGDVAQQIAHKNKIPLIFTYHTQYEEYAHYVPLLPQEVTTKTISFLVQRFCARTNLIISPTSSIKKQLQEVGIKNNIIVIPTPISDFFFANNRSAKKSDRFRLLTVSRFVPEKNLFFLLDMMRLLDAKRFELVLVGYGSLYNELQTYAYNTCGFSSEQIIFLEKPAREVLIEQYRNADVFVFTSKTETQGLVLAEAMANHLPVIALNAPGSKDIVQSNVNGFLVDSANEMKEKIEKIAADVQLHSQLAEGASNTAQLYRAHRCLDDLITEYLQLIGNE